MNTKINMSCLKNKNKCLHNNWIQIQLYFKKNWKLLINKIKANIYNRSIN